MKPEFIVAIIAGIFSLLSVAGTFTISYRTNVNATAIEKLKIDNEIQKSVQQKKDQTLKYSEPLARAAYDLQSRLYNILKQDLIQVYLVNGSERTRTYTIENTTFLAAQYLCWTEIIRREAQLIDLGESAKTRQLFHLQDEVSHVWLTDEQSAVLRLFAGEQRAIGEVLIVQDGRGSDCMGFGQFLELKDRTNVLLDYLRADVVSLPTKLSEARPRLIALQNKLIDLLSLLDPDFLRFPEKTRTKV